MYQDTIDVANKVITAEDLNEIFSLMNEKLMYYKKVYETESMQNKILDYSYQKWTFKDYDSSLKFHVNFTDNTEIKFDNYTNFIGIFHNRLDEIKSIYVYFSIHYDVKENGKSNYYSQHIYMDIYENKANIQISLSSEDKKIEDVYEFIKNKFLNAEEKYDEVIKNKSKMITSVGLAIGFIPAITISLLLLFVPAIRELFAASYILYPIAVIFLAFTLGGTIGSAKLGTYYKTLIPDQKYAGYDSNKHQSIYKDDISKFVETSEILIGKNIDNQKYRKEIMECYSQYKKWIPYEIGVMIVLSIIVLFLG